MYVETTNNNKGDVVFVSWERIDIIQITTIRIYCNRFSTSDQNLRAMDRFGIHLLLEDNTWNTEYTIAKNDGYSSASTDSTFVNLTFNVQNYGIKLFYDQIDSPYADMCFSKITITHSVY